MVVCCCTTNTTPATGRPTHPTTKPTQATSGKGSRGHHNEEVCHGTGERRKDLLDQVKIFLNEFDERPCEAPPSAVAGPTPTKRLGMYDEYIRKHCQSWMPPNPRPPVITSIQTHEVRPTEDYERMHVNNNEYVTYVDARSKPPPPSCDCAKRNGLQDQCENPACKPLTPQCLATNPGPCCPPSMGLPGRANQQPSTRQPLCHAARVGSFHKDPSKPSGTTFVDYTPKQTNTSKLHSPPQGPAMVCFCKAEPDDVPTGQKFMCCPSPIYQ